MKRVSQTDRSRPAVSSPQNTVVYADTPQTAVADDETVSERPQQPLPDDVYEGLAGFRYAMRKFLAFSEVVTTAVGTTSQQYQAMLVIRAQPDQAIMIKDLAHQLLLQPNGAVQLVDRLANAGLVERRQSTSDRRSVLVALTSKGRHLLEDLAADHLREMLTHEPLLAESLRRLRHMGRKSHGDENQRPGPADAEQ